MGVGLVCGRLRAADSLSAESGVVACVLMTVTSYSFSNNHCNVLSDANL